MSSIGKLTPNRGFTLLELLVVAVILVTLSLGLYPRFRGTFDNIQLQNEAQRLVGLMEHMRALAVAQKKPWILELDSTRDSYAPRPFDDTTFHSEDRLLHRHKLEDVSLENSQDETLTFYPDGRIDAHEISLTSREGYRIQIKSHGGFGRIETQSLS